MNILSISADRRLADPTSEPSRRQEAYRKALGEMTVLVRGIDRGMMHKAVTLHRKRAFDAVTSQDAFLTGLIAWRISRRLGIPWVAQVHNDVSSSAFRSQSVKTSAHWLTARILLPKARSIRAVSERAARGIRRWVGGTVRVTVLPLAWRPDQIHTQRTPHATPTVLMASRLTSEKRIDDGLEAFARVRKHIPDARLIIAGDGPLRLHLETRAGQPDLAGAVTFLGWRDDVPHLMSEASVFVLSSAFEGYGTVIAEALSAGCPVVMTDVGNAGELVRDGISGLIVQVGDVHALADRIIRVLRDKALANRFSEAGLSAVRFLPSFEEYVAKYASLFDVPLSKPRILFITQAIDEKDPLLGFVCRWLKQLSEKTEHITAICLREGKHSLPNNISLLSLGKESRPSKFHYLLNFYRHMWRTRKAYDTVFVHMNQAYVLLGWPLWRILGKRIMLWRNHPRGNVMTTLASLFADRVLYTSPQSYTARFHNSLRMPVGIDTEFYRRHENTIRMPNSVLCLSRISPVKRIDILLDAVASLESGKPRVHIVGSPGPDDHEYAEGLKRKTTEMGITSSVVFSPAVGPNEAPALYSSVSVSVNMTPSGSMDKTILEAMACETPVVVSNRAFRNIIDNRFLFEEGDSEDMARKLRVIMDAETTELSELGRRLREYVVREHSLTALIGRLMPLL